MDWGWFVFLVCIILLGLLYLACCVAKVLLNREILHVKETLAELTPPRQPHAGQVTVPMIRRPQTTISLSDMPPPLPKTPEPRLPHDFSEIPTYIPGLDAGLDTTDEEFLRIQEHEPGIEGQPVIERSTKPMVVKVQSKLQRRGTKPGVGEVVATAKTPQNEDKQIYQKKVEVSRFIATSTPRRSMPTHPPAVGMPTIVVETSEIHRSIRPLNVTQGPRPVNVVHPTSVQHPVLEVLPESSTSRHQPSANQHQGN